MVELTSGNVITIAIAILSLLGTLVGVIWAMLNSKIAAVVDKNRRLNDKIDKLETDIHLLETGELRMLNEITRQYMRKEECEREHRVLLAQIKNG